MRRLLELVAELQEHARAIIDKPLTEDDAALSLEMPNGGDYSPLACAIFVLKMRRFRSSLFQSTDLFGDPAWEILLGIFIAENTGKRLSVTSACIGAAPPTTGLRWLRRLEYEKLITREEDSDDKRRVYVRLTERGSRLMHDTLAQLSPIVAR